MHDAAGSPLPAAAEAEAEAPRGTPIFFAEIFNFWRTLQKLNACPFFHVLIILSPCKNQASQY
jgi:hypothetical protein